MHVVLLPQTVGLLYRVVNVLPSATIRVHFCKAVTDKND